MALSQAQQNATDHALAQNLTILSAGPGCGKTFLIKHIIGLLSEKKLFSLVTALNVAIMQQLCKSFGIDPKAMGTTDDGFTTCLNFDKITFHAFDASVRSKIGSVVWGLGSPKRDTRFLAKSFGIDDSQQVGELEISPSEFGGLIERAAYMALQNGSGTVSADHIEKTFSDNEAIDLGGKETIAAYANALIKKCDIEYVKKFDKKNPKNWPMVSVSFKFAFMKYRWILAGAPIDADNVFIDEAQDLNGAMIEAIRLWITQGKKVVLAGDQFQELYAWAGAKNAMQLLSAEYGINPCVLNESRRFGASIGAIASTIIEPLAGPNYVIGVADETIDDGTEPTSAYLLPTNAQVVGKALELRSQGIECEIPESLANELIELVEDIDDLINGRRPQYQLSYFSSYGALSVALYGDENGKGQDARLSDVVKVDLLLKNNDAQTLVDLARECGVKVFSGINPIVTTVHRTKGEEFPIVELTLIDHQIDPDTKEPLPWSKEERMAMYVGSTRAQRFLRLVGSDLT